MKLPLRWLTLSVAVSLAACGGSSDRSTTAATPMSTVAPTGVAAATATSDTALFHQASAVVQPALDAKRGAASDPVTPVAIARRESQKAGLQIDLGAPAAADLERRERDNRRVPGELHAKAYRIGFVRPIAATSDRKALQKALVWTTTDSGAQRASLRLNSTGAVGLRVGVRVESLPQAAVLRVYADGETQALETTGAHINAMVSANIKADGDSDQARTYWMPPTNGAATVLEIDLPAGQDPAAVAFSVPQLSHMAENPLQASLDQIRSKSSCPSLTPDVTCTLPPVTNAVGNMTFTESGAPYVCTGTLIANRGTTQQGYLLSADHCISTQTVASTLSTYWFWRTSSCNSNVPNPNYKATHGGATMRYHQSALSQSSRNPTGTDTVLLDLTGTPPAGVMYVGWAFERHAINTGINYVGVHSPGGEFQRRSDGPLSNYQILLTKNAQGLYFGDTRANTQYPMYWIDFTTGITESGSSGSGLFANGDTSNPKIIGTLFGGSDSCDNPDGASFYGRFDLAYENGLIEWLNPGYAMVFRFYNLGNGTHFYSANVTERNNVRATIPSLQYEDPVFAVSPSAASGLSPVYRFFNTNTGVHFYTINEAERDLVLTYPGFNFEGIAWYASKSENPAPGSIEVFRFQHRASGTHLYTANVAERDNIINTLGASYNYEGVAYRAWPSAI